MRWVRAVDGRAQQPLQRSVDTPSASVGQALQRPRRRAEGLRLRRSGRTRSSAVTARIHAPAARARSPRARSAPSHGDGSLSFAGRRHRRRPAGADGQPQQQAVGGRPQRFAPPAARCRRAATGRSCASRPAPPQHGSPTCPGRPTRRGRPGAAPARRCRRRLRSGERGADPSSPRQPAPPARRRPGRASRRSSRGRAAPAATAPAAARRGGGSRARSAPGRAGRAAPRCRRPRRCRGPRRAGGPARRAAAIRPAEHRPSSGGSLRRRHAKPPSEVAGSSP